MAAMAAAAAPVTTQLLAQCRAEPVLLDSIRPDLCPALEQVILGHMQKSRRSTPSLNVGGWKSGEDFFSWPDEAVQELRQALVDIVGSPRLVAWAMVNRAGSQHPRHQHRAASLSGVYYVTVGTEGQITPTIFECPSDGKGRRYELEIDPHPGRVVISRGEMWHRVPKYTGEAPRITVAFDLRR